MTAFNNLQFNTSEQNPSHRRSQYNKWALVQSPLEKRFLEDCITVGLLVVPQYLIGKIHADFAIPEKKLAIECDSKMYHSTKEEEEEDATRNRIYKLYGWNVLRITGKAIYKAGENIAEDIKFGKYDDCGISYIYDSYYDDAFYSVYKNNLLLEDYSDTSF